ncbi:MAG: hypothetical protein ABI779_22510 [Acidobacteriota bacterium]
MFIGLAIVSTWNRPQLSITIAKALVSANRMETMGVVYEYRTLLDLQSGCMAWLVEHSAKTSRALPPAETPTPPRIAYGIYLENVGRTELSDIRLAFRTPTGTFEINASPQLSVSKESGWDPDRGSIQTVTVETLAPGAKGVILALLDVPDASVTITRVAQDKFHVTLTSFESVDTEFSGNQHVRFVGSRQLAEAPFKKFQFIEMLLRQKAVFGSKSLSVPMYPVEVSAEGGQWNVSGPYMSCGTFSGSCCYNLVNVEQRGASAVSPQAPDVEHVPSPPPDTPANSTLQPTTTATSSS